MLAVLSVTPPLVIVATQYLRDLDQAAQATEAAASGSSSIRPSYKNTQESVIEENVRNMQAGGLSAVQTSLH